VSEHREREMRYFAMLSREEQAQAIHRLSRSGMSDYGIASATQLSVEMIRSILGELRAAEASAA
jgi:ABC-type phosphate/phosphonate transport system ATPase subunit